MIVDQVNSKLKAAIIAKDAPTLECMRSIKTAFTNLQKGSTAEPTETDYLMLLKKLVKQRLDSAVTYRSAGRNDLALTEANEAGIITEFIPQEMTKEEVLEAINRVINSNSFVIDKKSMGTIVKAVVADCNGRTDGKTVSALVAELIAKQ